MLAPAKDVLLAGNFSHPGAAARPVRTLPPGAMPWPRGVHTTLYNKKRWQGKCAGRLLGPGADPDKRHLATRDARGAEGEEILVV